MECPKRKVVVLVIVSLLLSAASYSYVLTLGVSTALSPFQHYRRSSKLTTIVPQGELGAALEGASMKNKTLIIAIVNKAYTQQKSILDLFLDSFRHGEDTESLLNHLLLVTVDQTAFDRCNFLHVHCFKLVTNGVDFSGEKLYMSEDFIKMMWIRTRFLADVLKRGYSFVFTDIDVMWLRNPFASLTEQGEDLQISCDMFNGQPFDRRNRINTGLYFVNSNRVTISLFDTWQASKDNSTGMKEQDVLQGMIDRRVLRELGVKVRYLDTLYFAGFCQDSRDFRQVTTVHANCCRSIKAKFADLTVVLEDWKKFKNSSNAITIRWSAHQECMKSWRA